MSVQGNTSSQVRKYPKKTDNTTSLPSRDQHEKKSPSEWLYFIGSARQAADYEALTNYLINYIQQNFDFGDDIANAIVNQEPINTEA